jgi:2'-5' RNA ligase
MWQNPNEWVGRTARIRAQEQFPSGAYRAPAFLARHEDVTQKTALDFYHAIYGDDADEKLKAILESGVLKPGGEVAGTEKKYEKRAPKYRRDDTAVYLSPQLLKDDARYHFKIPAERVKNPEFELKRRIITLEKLLELQAKTDLQKIYDETTPPRRHRNIPQVMARQRIPVTAADVVEGIAFPKEELAALTERLAGGKTIGTTRISDERGKYKVGDVLPSELGQLRVRSVISGSDLPEHPYLAELTDEQKTILTGQPFDYVELEPAKAEDVTQKTAGLSREDIIAQLKTYGHPRMGISVGAAMTLRGLRDSTADIDAEAPPEVFGELHKKHGSPALSKSKLGDRVYRIPGSDIDLYESWDEGYEALPEVNALVATKPALLAFYRKLNRPKDQPWIQALEQEQKEATVQPRLMVMAALLKQAAAPAKMMAPAAGSDRVSRLLAGVRQGHPAVPGVPDLQSQAREQLWSRGLVRRAQGQQPAFGQGRQQQPPQPVKPLQQPVPATPGKMMAPAAGADRVSRYMADFAVTHPPIPGGEAIRMDIARSQLRSQNFDRRSQPWLQQQPRQLQPRRPTNIGMVDAPTPASPVSPQVPQKVAADDAPRWGWLAVRLPPALQSKVRRLVSRIDRHDLAEGGKELEPHITVAYGLEATERDKPIIRQELENFKAPAITIGGASVFENQGYKVLKLDIDSPELHRLRQHIAGKYPMPGNTYTEYHPHITLAYLKPEVDESKYLDNDLVGQQFKGGRWVFRGKREQEKVAMSTPQELRQRLQKAAAEVEEDLGANAVFRIKWPSDRHPGRFEHLKLGPDVTSGMEATLAAPTTVMGTVTVPRVKIPDYEATRLGWQAARGMAADVAPPLIALAALLGVGGIGGVAYWHHRKNRKRQQDESLRKKQQQEKTAVTKSRELKQRLQKAAAEVAQTQEEEAKKRKGPTFGQKLLRGGLATAAGGMAGLIGGGYGGFKLGQHASNRLQDSALRELRADHQASRSGLSSLWMPPLSEENLKAIAGAATENDRAELEGTGALGGAALGAGGGALLGLALYLAFRRTGG